ncbi:hypothetical protein [Streptomyces sp. NPDC005955]|uniref:hypothetical protein n=1 Tax=Streptomyces sp. NPDC005955 TaxID=3364738 RepID=UPI0036BFCCF9
MNHRPPATETTPRPDTEALARWLLLAAEDRSTALTEWASRGVALLACGRTFDAVRVPCDLVRVATGAADDARAAAVLRTALNGGPVFLDRTTRQTYVLTACGTWATDRMPQVEHLGAGYYLGVPRLDLAAGRRRSHWAGPVDRYACPTAPLHTLLVHGLQRLRRAETATDEHA